jgi:hypothetical protein
MSDRPKVGLAKNPSGIPFRCTDCKYVKQDSKDKTHRCHKKEPELYLHLVDSHMCCDFFEAPGMEIIIP